MRHAVASGVVCLMVLSCGVTGIALEEGMVKSGIPPPADSAGPAEATAPATGGTPDAAHTVRSIVMQDNSNYMVLIVEPDGRIYPTQALCYMQNHRGMYFDVDWNVEALDLTRPGWSEVEGTLLLPEGYAFPGGDLTLKNQVIICDPEQSGVETVLDAYVIAGEGEIVTTGLDRDLFEQKLYEYVQFEGQYTLLHDDRTYQFTYPVYFNSDYADLDTPGSYDIFKPLPAYFKMDRSARQRAMIHVEDADSVDLRAWRRDGFGTVTIDFLARLDAAELWASVDGGAWVPADTLQKVDYGSGEDPLLFSFQRDYGSEKIYRLQIVEPLLVVGHTYEFEVRYGEGRSSVNSFVLDLRDGYGAYYGYGGGSRGGDDRETTETPAPVPASSPGSGAAALPAGFFGQGTSGGGAGAAQTPDPAPSASAMPTVSAAHVRQQKRVPAPSADRQEAPAGAEGASARKGAGGPAAIVVVGVLSALVAAVLWRLLGRRLVERR